MLKQKELLTEILQMLWWIQDLVLINAPESRTRNLEEKAKGLAAKARLEELLDKGNFILESHGVGKFGRCLGSLHVDDVNINKVLVSEGHANEYFGGKR